MDLFNKTSPDWLLSQFWNVFHTNGIVFFNLKYQINTIKIYIRYSSQTMYYYIAFSFFMLYYLCITYMNNFLKLLFNFISCKTWFMIWNASQKILLRFNLVQIPVNIFYRKSRLNIHTTFDTAMRWVTTQFDETV